MSPSVFGWLALGVTWATSACASEEPARFPEPEVRSGSRLPDYAAPKRMNVDYDELVALDTIPYRTLTRDDFKGTEPPAAFAPVADRLGAATCAHIVLRPAQLTITPLESATNVLYEAKVDALKFEAFMNRSCSWWNGNMKDLPEAYVLEHEQVHFAFFELEARRLNTESRSIAESVRATGASAEEAGKNVQRNLDRVLEQGMARVMARGRALDEDSSLGYEPARQKVWVERVRAELAASGD